MAFIWAKIFRQFFKEDEAPFVLELPPYRMPTGRSVLIHVWDKTKEYLKKMGGIILIGSIIVWFLGYFPRDAHYEAMKADPTEADLTPTENGETPLQIAAQNQKQNSYIAKIGHAVEPVFRPLGFTWQMGVGLIAGAGAKEVVVSTLNILYLGDEDSAIADGEDQAVQRLSAKMKSELRPDGSPAYTPLIAFAFLVFVLLYFPCIATIVAIKNETGGWKWAGISVIYTCLLAWITSFVIYHIGVLIGL